MQAVNTGRSRTKSSHIPQHTNKHNNHDRRSAPHNSNQQCGTTHAHGCPALTTGNHPADFPRCSPEEGHTRTVIVNDQGVPITTKSCVAASHAPPPWFGEGTQGLHTLYPTHARTQRARTHPTQVYHTHRHTDTRLQQRNIRQTPRRGGAGTGARAGNDPMLCVA